MIPILGLAVALLLAAVPAAIAAIPPIAIAAGIGALLVALALATGWRWPGVAGIATLMAAYAGALWLAKGPPDIPGAAAYGLGLVLLLDTADLARRTRRSTVEPGVVRAALVRAMGLGAATLAAAVLGGAFAMPLASAIPAAATPWLAAAGALAILGLAALIAVRAAPRADR